MKTLLPLLTAATLAAAPLLGASEPPRLALDWSLLPGSRDYVTSGGTERGMAVNPVEGHLYISSRAGSALTIAILDLEDGTELGFLDTSGISGGTFDLNTIAVADDGAIFGGNLTTNAGSENFILYRWANSGSAPNLVYIDDPGSIPSRRWGDAMTVTGAGDDTRIIITSHHSSQNNSLITLLEPGGAGVTDWFNHRWLQQDDNLALGIGLSFIDANTFYGTSVAGASPRGLLHRVGFDAASGTTTTTTYSAAQFNPSNSIIGFDSQRNLLVAAAPASDGLPTRVSLYDATRLDDAAPPLQVLPLEVSNTTAGGTGAIQFHDDRVYVLLSNNGLHVYQYTDLSELELWRLEHFGAFENSGDAANNANPAGDGIPNLVKFALGLDPLLPAHEHRPSGEIRAVYPGEFAWVLAPGDYDFLTTDGTERGMAYNPVTGNVYVVSRSLSTTRVAIICGEDGEHKGFLDMTGIPGTSTTFDLNMIAVGDDGAIYAGSLTTNAGNDPFRLFRWDSETATPALVYSGEPGANAGGRWGDNLAARGAGGATEVLILSHSTNANVFSQQTILRPSSASMENFVPTHLTPTTGSTGLGTAFGNGNVFWATRGNIPVNEVGFDLQTGEATLLRSLGTDEGATVDATLVGLGPIGIHTQRQLLAGIRAGTANLYLYDTAELAPGIANIPAHIISLPSSNSTVGGGSGDVAFGPDRVFAMHVNNGLVALDVVPSHYNTLTFSRPVLPPAGVDYLVEVSSDLVLWDSETPVLVSETTAGGRTTPTYRDSEPMGSSQRRFIRLRVAEQE